MATRRGDDDRALGHLLAADVGEVNFISGINLKPFVEPRRSGLDVDLPGEKADGLGQARNGDHVDAGHDRRFARVFARHEHSAQALLLSGGDGHRERPFGGPHAAIQRKFAHHGVVLQPVGGQLPAAGQNA